MGNHVKWIWQSKARLADFIVLKMLLKVHIWIFLIASALLGCNSKPKENQKAEVTNSAEDQLPHTIKMRLPISKAKQLYLSEIADSIEYIRLETNKENMVGMVRDIQLSDDYLFFNDLVVVTQFTRDGKFIRKVNRLGHGPDEFDCQSYCVDPIDQIITMTGHYKKEIYQFDFNGKLINKFFPNSMPPYYVQSIQKVPGKDIIIMNFDISCGNMPYRFFLVSGNGTILKKVPNFDDYTHHERVVESTYFSSPFFLTPDLNLLYKHQLFDTIFNIQSDKKIYPQYVYNLGNNKLSIREYVALGSRKLPYSIFLDKIFIMKVMDTKRFIFFTHLSANKSYLGLYDKFSHTVSYNYQNTVINDMDGGIDVDFGEMYQYKNKIYCVINPMDLLKKEEGSNRIVKDNGLQKNLMALKSRINENDNPIIMVIKLKLK